MKVFLRIFRMLRLTLSRAHCRMLSTSGVQNAKNGNLVQELFLKKIQEYGTKLSAKGDILLDLSAEAQRSLDDQLQRLASRFHLENVSAVSELPKKLETPEVVSAVNVLLDGKTLDDLRNDAKKEVEEYTAARQRMKAEEEARIAALREAGAVDADSSSPNLPKHS